MYENTDVNYANVDWQELLLPDTAYYDFIDNEHQEKLTKI